MSYVTGCWSKPKRYQAAYADALTSFFILRFQLRYDTRIREGRRITERLALGNVLEQATNDLSRARLWHVCDEQNVFRARDRADFLHDVLFELGDKGRAGRIALLENHERRN